MEGIYLIVKYRVHEVAKDFGRPTKEIADILTKYATAPKNHMQVLEDRELSILFDYLTQHNQVQSIESIYADTYHEPKPAPQGAKPAPAALSSGMARRLALVRALALASLGCSALLLDEPFTGVDGPRAVRLMEAVRALEAPVLLSAHEGDTLALADQIFFFQGPPLKRV